MILIPSVLLVVRWQDPSVGLHASLCVLAFRGSPFVMVTLIVLNFGLVAMYPAFSSDAPTGFLRRQVGERVVENRGDLSRV